jgi:hypothetical protein
MFVQACPLHREFQKKLCPWNGSAIQKFTGKLAYSGPDNKDVAGPFLFPPLFIYPKKSHCLILQKIVF